MSIPVHYLLEFPTGPSVYHDPRANCLNVEFGSYKEGSV